MTNCTEETKRKQRRDLQVLTNPCGLCRDLKLDCPGLVGLFEHLRSCQEAELGITSAEHEWENPYAHEGGGGGYLLTPATSWRIAVDLQVKRFHKAVRQHLIPGRPYEEDPVVIVVARLSEFDSAAAVAKHQAKHGRR